MTRRWTLGWSPTEYDCQLVKKWPESDKKVARVGKVAGDDSGDGGLQGWSQNIGLRVTNLSGVVVDGVWLATR